MTLLGKNVVIEVSEPWDFAGPEGSNRIPARIVEVGWKSVIAEAENEIDVPDKKVRGTRLDIQPRYVGGRLRDITLGKCLTVGIAVIPSGKSKHAAVYAMIGMVWRVGCENGAIA
jgi:hypothetical protein